MSGYDDVVEQAIRDAYGPEVMAWVDADPDGYGAARRAADDLTARHVRGMEATAQVVAAELSNGLPDGLRFEFVKDTGARQAPVVTCADCGARYRADEYCQTRTCRERHAARLAGLIARWRTSGVIDGGEPS